MKQKKNVSPPSVATGQLWKLAESNIEMRLILVRQDVVEKIVV